ncbi:alpha/beta fold hydrolase [Rhizobium beringeri]
MPPMSLPPSKLIVRQKNPKHCLWSATHLATGSRVLAHHWPSMTKSVGLLAAIIGSTISPELLISVNVVSDNSKPDADRLFYLERDFFAPGHDASVWLSGWHTEVSQFQLAATNATADSSWTEVGKKIPVLYVAPEFDKIAPVPEENYLRDRVGHLTTLEIIHGAGHALLPEKVSEAAAVLVSFAQSIMRGEGGTPKSSTQTRTRASNSLHLRG